MTTILRKMFIRLKKSLALLLNERDERYRQDIGARMQEMALQQTVDYVMANMEKAVVLTTAIEVYDWVFQTQHFIKGLYCEFGVYSGTTINYMAKKWGKEFHGFDSFEGLPENWYGAYEKGTFDRKGQLPAVEPNVRLYKGWFEETLPAFLEHYSEPVAFLHVDCDLYSSTETILQQLKDRIVPGTIIIFDEYFNYPFWQNHEHKAFQEFVEEFGWQYEYLCFNKNHQQVAVRMKS